MNSTVDTSTIVVDRVTKTFSSVRAVDELSFTVEAGQIFALLGPNGAGKSTMVRMLVGILQPDSGSVSFPHYSMERSEDRNVLGYLPEERGLHRDTPVLRSLEYFGVLNGMQRNDAEAAARTGLERFELIDRANERVDSLSKGNQQKVQFLAATLHDPPIAVLDEPFSGLDPINQERFLEEIRRLKERGSTIILSAHQMDLVETAADRLLLLNRGKAVLEGTLDDIRTRSHSGIRLSLELDSASSPDLEFLQNVEGIETTSSPSPGRLELQLRSDVPVGGVLNVITQKLPVISVHTVRESLREIFLRTVREEEAS